MFPLISNWSLVSASGEDGKCGISFDKAKQFQGLLFSQITVVHHAAPFPLPSVQLCDVNISFACLLTHTGSLQNLRLNSHSSRTKSEHWLHLVSTE